MCPLCDSACALVVEYEAGQIVGIRGDQQDPFSQGHVCPKGVALQDLHNDPDRLRRPVIRRGKDWHEVSWTEAYQTIAKAFARIQQRHGNDGLAVYYGNPVAHNHGSLLHLLPTIGALHTKNVYSANSVDALPRMLVSHLVYGNQAAVPVPDLDRTQLFVIQGANPVISHGSAMTAPDCKRRLRQLQQRGGRIVVLDPRRTETAELADEHHFVRPGSDGWLLLAVIHVLFRDDLVNLRRAPSGFAGVADLAGLAERFSPERVAVAVGLEAKQIEKLARSFAMSPAAVWYGRMGTCTQAFGSVATWLIDVVNLLTGNFDHPGGSMFPTPAVDLAGLAKRLGQGGQFNRWRSRVGGLPEFNGEFPVAALADEMETPGPGQIKALLSLAGNMVLSLPNGRRLERALDGLEFMASIDFFINETTRFADVILPPCSPLECSRYPLLEYTLTIRNRARYEAAVFPLPPDAKEDWELFVELGAAIARERGWTGPWRARLRSWFGRLGQPDRVIDLLLRLGPQQLSLGRLKEAAHGIDFGALEPRLKDILNTTDGRVQLTPRALVQDIERLEQSLAEPPADPGELLLISRRTLRSMNSWLHNCPRLVRGADRCTLEMHPSDAVQRNLTDGQTVQLSTQQGCITVPFPLPDQMMPTVVSLPFGWGHDRPGTRLSVASQHPGASMNDIMDDAAVDVVSGTSVLDGVPVEVSAARSS